MTTAVPPILDPRDSDTIAAQVLARIPGYVPGWVPDSDGPGTAMAYIYGRLLNTLAGIINQAPVKDELACFDQLGIELLSPQAARAPVVFTAIPAVGNSQVPAGASVGAQIPGSRTPLTFQTEQTIALAAASIVQVVALWPGRDAYADYSAALQQGQPFTLFEQLQLVDHELYMGDETVLALAGQSIVEVRVELATPSSSSLDIAWEYWDGGLWRQFKDFKPAADAALTDSVDATNGLTRSGTIRLSSDCAKTVDTTVDAITTRWLRGRLAAPLLPVSGTTLPEIRTIAISSVIDRTLPDKACTALPAGTGIQPDAAFADKMQLDLTKAIQPLGPTPGIGSTFYLSCDEAMTKAGAEVTLCFKHVKTPDQSLDSQGAAFGDAITEAKKDIIAAAKASGQALIDSANGILSIMTDTSASATVTTAINTFKSALSALPTNDVVGLPSLYTAAEALVSAIRGQTIGITAFPGEPASLPDPVPGSIFTAFFTDLVSFNNNRIGGAAFGGETAAADTTTALKELAALSTAGAAGASGAKLPSLSTPELAWEYWNGTRWSNLAPGGTSDARNFTSEGPVTFTVPDDVASATVNGSAANWVRARITTGGYGVVQTVTWTDQATGLTNVFPIILIRPPVIDTVVLGYLYKSPSKPPDSCLTYNDFQFADHSSDVHTSGSTFRAIRN